jgi:hypothetical protein
MRASIRQFNKVIVSNMKPGRALALHRHHKRRVRKKYQGSVVVLRSTVSWLKDDVHRMTSRIIECGGMTMRGWLQYCRVLRRNGVEAWVERR